MVKLGNYALTYRIVDRIFEGACRRLTSGTPDRLGSASDGEPAAARPEGAEGVGGCGARAGGGGGG